MQRILVVGNYGIDGRLDGQTAKTRDVTKTIKKIYGTSSVETIDTAKVNLIMIFKFIFLSIRADKIVIMPAQRAITPIIFILHLLHKLKKTYYIVIGGWLYKFLLNHQKLLKKIRKLNYTLVEIESLKNKLLSLNINSEVIPNYRVYDNNIKLRKKVDKYTFYSRVREDKGVLIAIEAINIINKANNKKVYLDIYGPIDETFKNEFFEKIKNNKYIKYGGILNGNSNIIETLSQYKALLFPTYYEGEGVPGAVIESMIAGVPVMASDWKYNTEIIKNNNNGFIVKVKSIDDLKDKIELIERKAVNLEQMNINCIEFSKKYTEENAIKILKKVMED